MRGNVFNATVFCVVLLSHHIAMASGDDESCAPKSGGSDANWGAVLAEARRLLEPHGASVALIEPFGAEIAGLKLAELVPTPMTLLLLSSSVVTWACGVPGWNKRSEAWQCTCHGLGTSHGARGSAGIPRPGLVVTIRANRGQRLIRCGQAALNARTSSEGIVGPGAEWHCDGSFLEDVFSHAGYHIVQLPNVPAGELELPPSAVCGARSSGASVGCSQGRRSRTSGTRMRC
eukprot:3369987-Rhodomonas_salina.3